MLLPDKSNKNKTFMKSLNAFKKRTFCIETFGKYKIDTPKGLISQQLHKNVIEKYKVVEANGEYLNMKLKKFY